MNDLPVSCHVRQPTDVLRVFLGGAEFPVRGGQGQNPWPPEQMSLDELVSLPEVERQDGGLAVWKMPQNRALPGDVTEVVLKSLFQGRHDDNKLVKFIVL